MDISHRSCDTRLITDIPNFEYDKHAFCTASDSSLLVAALEHYASSVSGSVTLSPLVLEPEPAGKRKRRFRADVEDLTGFVAQFHFEPMRDGTVSGALVLDTPEPGTAEEIRALVNASVGIGVPADWELDDELLEVGVIALNAADVINGESGPWAIAALNRLGAPVPTGRWRFILPTIPRGVYE